MKMLMLRGSRNNGKTLILLSAQTEIMNPTEMRNGGITRLLEPGLTGIPREERPSSHAHQKAALPPSLP